MARGAAVKAKEFVFGHCASGNHSNCKGALVVPKSIESKDGVVRCTCPCHHGKEMVVLTPVESNITRPIVPGKRDPRRQKAWEETLRRDRTLSIVLPTDKADEATARRRMHTAATKQGLKIKVRAVEGLLVATVQRAQ
jgi:hypothetical protein